MVTIFDGRSLLLFIVHFGADGLSQPFLAK
jgi:hypothetical protein